MDAPEKKEKRSIRSQICWQLLFLAGLVIFARSDLIQNTFAVLRDQEKSAGNKFQAGELGFSLASDNSGENSPLRLMAAEPVEPEALYKKEITLKNQNDSAFDYDVAADNISGDLCGELEIHAERVGDEASRFQGALKDFAYQAKDFSGEDSWKFAVNLKEDAADWQGKKCEFDFIFRGRQKDFDILHPEGGFSDKKTLHNVIETEAAKEDEEADGTGGSADGADVGDNSADVIDDADAGEQDDGTVVDDDSGDADDEDAGATSDEIKEPEPEPEPESEEDTNPAGTEGQV